MTLDPVDVLGRMLEIESCSGHESALAAFLVDWMRSAGFEAAIDGAGNAVGVRSGPPATVEHELILLGHMDTVPGWIRVRREGDALFGRGAVDAKGPLAAFLCAAARADLAPGARVVVIGAVEEEATSRGARYLVDRFRPDAVVIGEPSSWDAVTLGYKGRLLADYTFERHVGHTAGPDGGVAESAVAWWNRISALADEFNCDRGRQFDRLMASLRHIATASDGLVERVDATAAFRLPPRFDVEGFESRLRAFDTSAAIRFRGREAAFESPRSTPLAAPFLRAIRDAGGQPRFKVKTGTSDMNVVGPAWQCPIVAYGPGDSSLDHTPNEHISLDEYARAIDVLESVIANWAQIRTRSAQAGSAPGTARL